MEPAPQLRSVNELLSVALVMERAAAARYAELARRMVEREHDELADLFTRLGRLERDHARFLERRLAGQATPQPAVAASLEFAALDEDALLASDVALIASGTTTPQAALHEVPMMVVYRPSPLTYLIGKLMVKIPHFSLVYVLLDRSAAPSSAVRVKELIQSQVHRETIMTELTRLIEEGPYRAEVIAHLEAVRRLFIPKSASQQVAGVVEMLGSAV